MIPSLRSCVRSQYILIGHAAYIYPCYSLKNMAVNPGLIFVFDTQNIQRFFYDVLEHPDLIFDLWTQEQKRETWQSIVMKEDRKRKEVSGTTKSTRKTKKLVAQYR